jgi:hypothetical protein
LKPVIDPYALLVSIIVKADIIGLDAPVSLPLQSFVGYSYEDLLREFPVKFKTANDLYMYGKTFEIEPKRQSERAARVPFSAYNLRLFRQTWHAIMFVVRPLVNEHDFAVAGALQNKEKILLEACPASYWKLVAGFKAAYKGKSENNLKERINKLDFLVNEEKLSISEEQRERIIQNTDGDLLDAVTCAVIAKNTGKTHLKYSSIGEPGVFYGKRKK